MLLKQKQVSMALIISFLSASSLFAVTVIEEDNQDAQVRPTVQKLEPNQNLNGPKVEPDPSLVSTVVSTSLSDSLSSMGSSCDSILSSSLMSNSSSHSSMSSSTTQTRDTRLSELVHQASRSPFVDQRPSEEGDFHELLANSSSYQQQQIHANTSPPDSSVTKAEIDEDNEDEDDSDLIRNLKRNLSRKSNIDYTATVSKSKKDEDDDVDPEELARLYLYTPTQIIEKEGIDLQDVVNFLQPAIAPFVRAVSNFNPKESCDDLCRAAMGHLKDTSKKMKELVASPSVALQTLATQSSAVLSRYSGLLYQNMKQTTEVLKKWNIDRINSFEMRGLTGEVLKGVGTTEVSNGFTKGCLFVDFVDNPISGTEASGLPDDDDFALVDKEECKRNS